MPPRDGISDSRQPGGPTSQQRRVLLWIKSRGGMNEVGRLPSAWARYDDVAEPYERFQASNGYARLARDLVTALNLTPGASLLDVGCGSGAATLAVQGLVGAHGFVVGLDISLPMLRRAALGGAAHLVAGIVPGLPFHDGCFDAVTASLVLSHVERYEAALRDMVRVLKPGGRLGVSAGAQRGNRPNAAYQAWEETAESLVGREALREAKARVAPWEEWLTDPAHFETALASVGLEDIEVDQREYPVTMPTNAYLAMLDLFAYGRFLRHCLGRARWEEFRESVARKVAAHGLKQIEYTSRYHVGVGHGHGSATRAAARHGDQAARRLGARPRGGAVDARCYSGRSVGGSATRRRVARRKAMSDKSARQTQGLCPCGSTILALRLLGRRC